MKRARARRSGIAALMVMAFLSNVPVTVASQAKTYSLDAYPFPKADPMRQWRSVLGRASSLAARWGDVPCRDGAPALACAADEADRLVQRLKDLSPQEQIAGVYAFYNAFRYRHRRDECGTNCWATPIEFIAKRSGDCHDYAVAEYMTLRRLGFDHRNLRLILVQMKESGNPLAGGHIVLRVSLPDRDIILDNRKTSLSGPDDLKEYSVLAGLNAQNIEIYAGPLAHQPDAKPAAPKDAGACRQTASLANWNAGLPC